MGFTILLLTVSTLHSAIYALQLQSPTHTGNNSTYYYNENMSTEHITKDTQTIPSYYNDHHEIQKIEKGKTHMVNDTYTCKNCEVLIESYDAMPSNCKGILFGPKGNISSSGYPENSPPQSNCLWIICGDPNQVIRLVWYSAVLEKPGDKLKVYTEITLQNNTWNRSRSRVYMDIKTRSQAYAKTFSPPFVAIEFISRSSGVKGFLAKYWMLDEDSDCEMEYFGESGIIKSPHYPEDHISRFPCIWKIRAPFGWRIVLNITEFSSQSVQCEDGYMEIRNGPLSTSPSIKTICDIIPADVLFKSDSNSMSIGYFSAIPHLPFQLSWNTIHEDHTRHYFMFKYGLTDSEFDGSLFTACGGFRSGSSGSIESPDYSGIFYRSGSVLYCEWIILVNHGSTIELEFVDIFQLNSPFEECGCSEIEIYDGTQYGFGSKLLAKICANQYHGSVHSWTDTVTIIFNRKDSIGNCLDHASLSRNVGFRIKYKAVTSRIITGFDGIIESFNYPRNYPPNLNISWIIEVSEGNSIDFNFTDFRLEDGDDISCPWDYVEISEWDRYKKNSEVSTLGKFCGNEIPEINALGDTVMINLVTDGETFAEGISLSWKEKGCIQTITVNNDKIQNITTPKYPLKYSNNAACRWRLEASLGSRLELRLDAIEIEWEQDCKYDLLQIHDGPSEISHRIFEVCGILSSPVVLTSSRESLFIGFKSDSTVTYSGFAGTVRRLNNNDCQHEIRANSGFIYSRDFEEYPDPIIDCTWDIFVDKYLTISVDFIETPRWLCDVASELNHINKMIEILEGNTILMSCDTPSVWDSTIESLGNELMIKYKTDTSPDLIPNWFSLKFKARCKSVVTDTMGILKTPSIIAGAGQLVNCSWNITPPEVGVGILLLFTKLNWAVRGSNCMDQYVRVGIASNNSELFPLFHDCCGPIPGPLYTTDSGQILEVVGSLQVEALFAQIPHHCNTNISNTLIERTVFSLAGYSNDCILSFEQEDGTRIKLLMHKYYSEIHKSKCNTGYVEVYESYFFAKLENVFCQTNIPTNRKATNIQYWVVYIQ